ncbi:MAG: CRISPR-associated endoribonuclease Cas6, partial [Rivularia sp. ALOHA_DT_140]|nr:CRISPR-associated endoribonuclease Cas6 [Rivularia sp. ALOHA_DT_140]
MPRTRKKSSAKITLPKNTELVGIVFHVSPASNYTIFPEYAKGLHAWFLNQVRQTDPDLSAYLHDGESEKPFTISRLQGELLSTGTKLQLLAGSNYKWNVSVLSSRLAEWMRNWLQNLPKIIELRSAPLQIKSVEIAHKPTNYEQLLEQVAKNSLPLSYISPTSFRRKKHHFPLPLPFNIFQSYLRRWNDFSGLTVEANPFLEWVDDNVIIQRHQISSARVPGGKRGLVTGFTGAVEFGLSKAALDNTKYVNLYRALGRLAPYCGTGHKTTFGLGQTRLGWLIEEFEQVKVASPQEILADRIEQITEILMSKQKRTGGDRAISVCEKRAVIMARRETGESLQDIATDLEIPYETVKTYVKLTRKILVEDE